MCDDFKKSEDVCLRLFNLAWRIPMLLACTALLGLGGCEKSPSLREQLLKKERLVFLCQHHLSGAAIPEDLAENAADVDVIAPMWFDILDDGSLADIQAGSDYEPYIQFCRENGIALMPIVRNFKPATLFSDPEAVERAIREIIALSERFDGITVDIEEDGSDGVTREPMLRLLRETYAGLKARGKLHCATFNPMQWERGKNWQGPEMLEFCDWAFGMFYDYSGPWNKWRGGNSTAPYEWPERGHGIRVDSEKILAGKNNRKFLFGIPAYGNDCAYDAAGECVAITARPVIRLVEVMRAEKAERQWDTQARSPYYEYEKEGLQHRVWYEDAESYAWRMQWANDWNCAGIGVWSVGAAGGPDPDFWDSIRQYRKGAKAAANP